MLLGFPVPPGKETGLSGSYAVAGRDHCDRLFSIENELKDLSPEDRYTKRLELENRFLMPFGRGWILFLLFEDPNWLKP